MAGPALARPNAQGRWEILGDPRPQDHHSAQLSTAGRGPGHLRTHCRPRAGHIEASGDSLGQWWSSRYTLDEYHQRLTHVRTPAARAVVQTQATCCTHDQPEQVAQLIEEF